MPLPSKKIFFEDLMFRVYENVYQPAEDSFLFAENLTANDGDVIVDVGTGCGLLGIVATKKASRVLAVDINPYAVRCAMENAKLNHVKSKMFFLQTDLFAAIKTGTMFDLILFNAPYLPVDYAEENSWLEHAWVGGASGRQVIDRFIYDTPKYLKRTGRILLMQSTLSNVDETLRRFEKRGLNATVVAKCDLPFFESIVLVEAEWLS
jgi:release factor glutamine methyltransferase